MIEPIYLKNIEKSYPYKLRKRKILQHISLSVQQGEVFGFIGPNGAGKSTLINLLMGFIRPDKGVVQIHGLVPDDPKSRQQIGYLPEGPRFYDNLTPAELLIFGGNASGISKNKVRKMMDPLLSQLEILQVKNRPIHTFSKGMKQRLGLALAMIHDPDLLILDEPMSGLDPIGRTLMKNIILDLKTKGRTVFFSSHILNDVETLCNRIGIIHHGHILYCGTIDAFLNGSQNIEARFTEIIENAGRGTIQ